MGKLTEADRIQHLSEMPLGLVGKEWEPGGAEFEAARVSTGRALSKLARVNWPTDQVMDWEVRSWLRQRHYGDASMQGLRRAAQSSPAPKLTERQRRFLWQALRGLEPWDCETPLRDPELRAVTDAGLVAKAIGRDDDGDEVWWWETTPAGRAALAAAEGGRDG